jgi:hypothetical protein
VEEREDSHLFTVNKCRFPLIKTSCSKFSAIKIRPGLLRPQNVRPVLESLPSASREERTVLYLTNSPDQASLKNREN